MPSMNVTATINRTEIGQTFGSYPFVTLCYRRPRRLPAWPYNLFCMIHGRDREAVCAQVEQLAEDCGLVEATRDILFSRRCFKQRGARYGVAPDAKQEADEKREAGVRPSTGRSRSPDPRGSDAFRRGDGAWS